MCVLIDVFVLLCSFVIICLLYIFVVVVFFFVADTLYRLCLLCMPSIVVNLILKKSDRLSNKVYTLLHKYLQESSINLDF